MIFAYFIISLILLCAACIAAFISAFSDRKLLLVIFVPIITFCGSIIYFSYESVLGYPIEMSWQQLPDKFTVIYFRIEKKEKIHLWIFEGQKTRLVTLPYNKPAEEAMESERETMGKGTPVTFSKSKTGSKQGESEKQGKGKPGQFKGGKNDNGTNGVWRYNVESKGDPIPGNALSPKLH